MNVRNCKKCGKIFNYITGPIICPICRAAVEEKFQEVKKYVYANRGATMQEISDNCNVEISQVQFWIREERLVFSEDSPISIGCEKCGTMIKTGKYCAKCKAEMTNTFGQAMGGPKKPETVQKTTRSTDPRMRYL